MNIALFFTNLALFAFLIETVVEILKPLFDPLYTRFSKVPIPYYVSIVLGVGGALLFQVNGLEMFGITNNVLIGQVITGLLCSRGSNFLHEIYQKLREMRDLEATPVTPVSVVVESAPVTEETEN